MTVLTELRAELAQMLNDGGIQTFDYIPERINPPVAVIAAGSPFVEEVFDIKTFNHDYRINMEVTLIAGRATNETESDELDDLIYKTIIALHGAWTSEVQQPVILPMNNAEYLAATVSINTTITID